MYFLKKYIQSNYFFLGPYLFIILLLVPYFILITRLSGHLAINSFHSALLDLFFKYITWFGDGITPFIVAFIFLFVSFRKALILAASGTLGGLIAQIFKRFVFSGVKRPYGFFKEWPGFHFVEGIHMHSSHSFPSGHAATIFALCLVLAGFTKSKPIKLMLFLTAAIVAFSRAYLSQHFLIDIYAGSFIGIVSALIIVQYIEGLKAKWPDRSLLKVMKK